MGNNRKPCITAVAMLSYELQSYPASSRNFHARLLQMQAIGKSVLWSSPLERRENLSAKLLLLFHIG